MVRDLIFILFIIICYCYPGFTQTTNVLLSIYTIEEDENLQADYTYLDQLGFLWIVSDKTTWRYDGYNLHDLSDSNGFNDIIARPKKIIETDELVKYFLIPSAHYLPFLSINSTETSRISWPITHSILDVSPGMDGKVVVLSYHKDSLYMTDVYDKELHSMTALDRFRMVDPKGKIVQYENIIYYLIENELYSYDISSKERKLIHTSSKDDYGSILGNKSSMHVTSDHKVIWSTIYSKDVYWTDMNEKDRHVEIIEAPSTSISLQGIWADENDQFIIGWRKERSFLDELRLYPNINREYGPLPTIDASLEHITGNDFSEKIFCVGYYDINTFYIKSPQFINYLDTIVTDGNYLEHVKSMRGMTRAEDGYIYILREVESLFKYDSDNGRIRSLPLKTNTGTYLEINCTNRIYQLDGFLWFSSCSNDGKNYLIKYDTELETAYPIESPERIQDIYPLNDSTLLLACSSINDQSSVLVYHTRENKYEKAVDLTTSFTDQKNTFITVEDEIIYLGSNSGLETIDPRNLQKTDHLIDLKALLQGHHVSHITSIGSQLLVSTIDMGLVICNKETNELNVINREDGLLSNAICASVPDQRGKIWISTFNGLYVLDNNGDLVKAYFEEDGLNNNEFNRQSYLFDDASLYFGGINGFLRIELDDIDDFISEPVETQVSSIAYYDSEKEEEVINYINGNPSSIHLNPAQNNLRIVVANSLARKRGNLIRLRITGHRDGGWNYISNSPEIQFGYLDQGKYTLVVQEKGQGLSWDNASHWEIPLIKEDYFYNNPIFRAGVIIAVISGIFYFFYRRRKNRIEMLETRQQIASDLHDEIGSVLTGIASKAEIMSLNASKKSKEDIKYVIDDSKKALELMRDTIWSVNPDHDSLKSLTDRMKDFAYKMLAHKEIPINYNIHLRDEERMVSPVFRKEVYMIFKESITNVLKHSEPTIVDIEVKSYKKHYHLKIKNDGTRMSKSDGLKIGMKSMEKRAAILNGTIDVQKGPQFLVSLSCPIQ